MPRILTTEEVHERLKGLPGWAVEGSFITKTIEFPSFMEGIEFLNRVAEVAEGQDHHPDISVRYTKVKLAVQTHSEGGITARDFRLAEAIERKALAQKKGA